LHTPPGDLEQALARALRAVVGARACLPEHGFVASVLLKLGRVEDAEEVVAQAAELATGVADAYDWLAFAWMALGRRGYCSSADPVAYGERCRRASKNWLRSSGSERCAASSSK
jgi:hypothetical protein